MTPTETPHDLVTEELLGWIQGSIHRLHGSVAGLTEAQVRRPVTASGWSIAGLVGHVHDSTWFWLHHVAAGHPMDFDDREWNNDPETRFLDLLDNLQRDTARASSEVEHLSSDAAPGWWPEGAWGGYRLGSIRSVLIHLLNDNAAHTGHMDLAREGIDRGVWDFSQDSIRIPARI